MLPCHVHQTAFMLLMCPLFVIHMCTCRVYFMEIILSCAGEDEWKDSYVCKLKRFYDLR